MGRTFGSVRGRIVVPGGELDGAVVHLAGGRIERIERPGAPVPPAPGRLDLPGCRVYPGWINLHVHGAMGRDFIDPEAGAAEAIARYLATQGFSGFLATYMTCSKEALGRALGHLATLVAARRPDVSAPLGVHLEGPFLDPAKKGSQPEEHLAPPSVELLDALLANVPDGLKVLMTLAPELPGADRVVDALLARGAVPAIGHTQATYARTMEAIRRGARHAVHLLNAMRPLHHREPGVVGAFLTTPGTTVEIIPDLVHLHPAIVRLVMALRGPDGVVLATDSIAPTGLGEGERLWAGRTVRVRGGRATLRDGTMAGSVLETARMLANLRELGVKAPDVARMLSTNPARVLGLGAERGEIAEGKRADLTVVDGDDRVTLVVSDGHAVWAAPELGLGVESGTRAPGAGPARGGDLAGPLAAHLRCRRRNHLVNRFSLELSASGLLEFLVLLKEDCSPEGLHRQEEARLQADRRRLGVVDRTEIQPGTDEGSMMLLARTILRQAGVRPTVAVRYCPEGVRRRTPLYEDRPLGRTLEAQLGVSGLARRADGDLELEVVGRSRRSYDLFVPAGTREGAAEKAAADAAGPAGCLDRIRRSPPTLGDGALRGLADVGLANGADPDVAAGLLESGAAGRYAAFGAWNTAANTVGSILAHLACLAAPGGDRPRRVAQARYLLTRWIDDYVYQTCVRRRLMEEGRSGGIDPYDFGPAAPLMTRRLRETLPELAARRLAPLIGVPLAGPGGLVLIRRFPDLSVTFPWARAFELEIQMGEIDVEHLS